MEIKVLGTGCAKCKALEKSVIAAVEKTAVDAHVTKVEEITEIMKYGIMMTPALVIDEKVVVSGRAPSSKEIIKLITKK